MNYFAEAASHTLERRPFSIGKDSVRSRPGRISAAKCRKCQHPREMLPLVIAGRHPPGSQAARPPASRPRLPMEPEKAPWSSGSAAATPSRRRGRSRSPGSTATAAAGQRDPYDYIRRTRIKADDWDTYWDNFPQGSNNNNNNNNINNNNNSKNNNNLAKNNNASADTRSQRPPDKSGPTSAAGQQTKEDQPRNQQQNGGKPPHQPLPGSLAMEDETLEPEVKPIASDQEGEETSSEAGRRLGRREAAASAAKMSAKSEFADLVAMKSHLSSAEFR